MIFFCKNITVNFSHTESCLEDTTDLLVRFGYRVCPLSRAAISLSSINTVPGLSRQEWPASLPNIKTDPSNHYLTAFYSREG